MSAPIQAEGPSIGRRTGVREAKVVSLVCAAVIGFLPCRGGYQVSWRISDSNAKQPGGGSAEDRNPLVVAQSRRAEHEVDLGAGPRERVVGADHDLARTGLRDQMA